MVTANSIGSSVGQDVVLIARLYYIMCKGDLVERIHKDSRPDRIPNFLAF